MILRVREDGASLFDKPNLPGSDAKRLKFILANQGINLREISRTADGIWIEVEAEFAIPRHGFVRAADVKEVTEFKFEPVELSPFVFFSTAASETFNQRLADASAGVSRDYILALALVLNGLEEKGLTDDVLQAFDPFQFTEAEWKKFCESPGNTSNYQDFDHFDSLAQIDGAVFVTSQLTSKIVHSLTEPADVGDPHIPNSMDLFLVHMLGDAGVAALKDLAIDIEGSSRGSKPWASFVSAAGGDIEALKKRYPKFLDGQDKASVDQVLGLIETAFGKAYVNVAEIVSETFPEDVPQTGGPPKWLEIAKGHLEKYSLEAG